MKVTVIGTGYVGLVTGTVFSIQGHDVTCVDTNREKIDGLRRGVLPIYEPGLAELVETGIANCCLSFSTDAAAASEDADVIFLAVGTPQSESGAADLSYLKAAAESIADSAKKGAVVVIKSTVPVGTNRQIAQLLAEKSGRAIDVASNPEFLKEGTAIDDCLNPDRIILGVRNKRVAFVLQRLYTPLLCSAPKCRLLTMEPESAEMTKYTANCFLAMKISFINQMATLCEQFGADIQEVRHGICSDRRIGWEFLKPGPGYGGSCFPKDVRALTSQAEAIGENAGLLKAIDDVNEAQKCVMSTKVLRELGPDLKGKNITIWGLAFKPGTDDIREAPALALIEDLVAAGANVTVHDPEAMENVLGVFGEKLNYNHNQWEAAQDADALVIMTEWSEYHDTDPNMLRRYLKSSIVFDARSCLDRERYAKARFDIHTIGQSSIYNRFDYSEREENPQLTMAS